MFAGFGGLVHSGFFLFCFFCCFLVYPPNLHNKFLGTKLLKVSSETPMTSSKINHFYLDEKYLKPTAEKHKFITADSIQCILCSKEGAKDTSHTHDSKEDVTAEITTRKPNHPIIQENF